MSTHKEEVKASPGLPTPISNDTIVPLELEVKESSVPKEEQEEIGKLVELESRIAKLETHYFVLRYKHRGAPKMLEFQHKDLESAILRGRQHCQTQGYKFIYVEPVYLDLDALDKRMDDNRRRDEGETV